jgi:plasmid replication initiation protein
MSQTATELTNPLTEQETRQLAQLEALQAVIEAAARLRQAYRELASTSLDTPLESFACERIAQLASWQNVLVWNAEKCGITTQLN